MTENLSDIVKLNESGKFIYPKGRAFGTPGEWLAARMIEENMTDFGLYTINESIQQYPNKEIDDKLEVLSKGLTVIDTVNGTQTSIDCFITPRWNETILELIIPGFDYNESLLTYNFSYSDLEIRHKPNIS